MVLTCDFNDSGLEQKIAKIGEFEFNMSEMPVGVYMFFNRRTAERNRENLRLLAEDYADGIKLWLQTLKGADVITDAWFNEVVTGPKLIQISVACVTPSMDPPKKMFENPNQPKNPKSKV